MSNNFRILSLSAPLSEAGVQPKSMAYFGDVSGHFRGLLNGHCDVCVVAVVAGDPLNCQRCPKRTMRRVSGQDQARWNELKEVEKRRFFQCLNKEGPSLSIGFGTYKQEQLNSLQSSHMLYLDDRATDWDIALKALSYTEVLMEMTEGSQSIDFTADQFASTPQRQTLVDMIENRLNYVSASTASAKQKVGIQTADCVAGGIREQCEGGEPWMDYLDDTKIIPNINHWSLAALQHYLSDM